jgi:luciferase family oxidoreductase group 1
VQQGAQGAVEGVALGAGQAGDQLGDVGGVVGDGGVDEPVALVGQPDVEAAPVGRVAAQALRRLPIEAFPGELGELLEFLAGKHPSVAAIPGGGSDLEVWLLGTSTDSAVLAGSLGLPYAFAYHIKAAGAPAALALYRESFQPSDRLSRPHTMISVQVICAEDDARARWLADPSQISFLRRGTRTFASAPYPSPEQAAALEWTAGERATADEREGNQAIGGPETVRRRLAEILELTTPDELMIMNAVTGLDARLRSLEQVPGLLP